ncbi:MAG: T9SS type A sorting domain-containing protein [Ferruginibacter sp.]
MITGDLKIFPNPVAKGNAIKLAFKLKETGAYHIQIINAAGQMLLLKQLQASSKNYTEQVQTNASWSGGVYYVRLLDEKNKLISTNSFVLQ